jgi:hypothetical protein
MAEAPGCDPPESGPWPRTRSMRMVIDTVTSVGVDSCVADAQADS